MKVVRKMNTNRLTEKMTIAHDVISRTGEVIAKEGTAVTKEMRGLLVRNFIEEVYVCLERNELSDEAYEYINEYRAWIRRRE